MAQENAEVPNLTTEPKRSRLRYALHVAAVILSAVVILALVRVFRRDGPAALQAWRAADVRWTWVVFATVSALGGHAISTFGWWRFLADVRVRVSFWLLARFFMVSNLGRYLPGGKAWQMGIVGLMAAENQLPAAVLAGTSLLQGLIGVAVGGLLLLVTGAATLGVPQWWFVLPAVGLAGLLASPALLKRLPGLRAMLVRRVPSIEAVTPGTMWVLVWTAAASYIAWGVALYALAGALLPSPGASLTAYITAWVGPFLAGIIAIIAPAGLGVRDGAMQAVLAASGVSAAATVVVVVVSRLWVTIVEVIPAVILLALRKRRAAAKTVSATEAAR